jgi:hypothetical protein
MISELLGTARSSRRYAAMLIGTASISFLILNCSNVDPPHQIAHACPHGYNSHWQSIPGLVLEHYEPRLCPLSVGLGDPLEVGGTVTENGVSHPTPGIVEDLALTVFGTYATLVFGGDNYIDGESAVFGFETASPGAKWSAQLSLSYIFQHNPNWMEFRAYSPYGHSPKAYVELNNGGPE